MALLEPQAPDSLAAWGFFNSCFEQKEHIEPYVAEQIAHAMLAQLRTVDQLGRFGGEEFLILLPDATLDDARACATRLLGSVAGLSLPARPEVRVTISIGLSACLPGESAHALLGRVDRALYQAKRDGRNRIAIGEARKPACA